MNYLPFNFRLLECMDYKLNQLNRSTKTKSAYQSIYFRFVTEEFGDRPIAEITEDELLTYFNSRIKALCLKPTALRKTCQLITSVFEFAVKRKYVLSNAARCIDVTCYLKDCDLTFKTAEEKEFSEEELEIIITSVLEDKKNPRALMVLMAAYTGMRLAELPALQWSDIGSEYLHIHRQQIISEDPNGNREFLVVSYTKDERTHPHDGRYFPISDDIRKVLSFASEIPGDSDYVFHDPEKSGFILKDSCTLYLKRRCRRLGIKTTNNHAFRMSLNSRLIEAGLSSADRALLLGHAVETNERAYSHSDKRRLEKISACLLLQQEKTRKL